MDNDLKREFTMDDRELILAVLARAGLSRLAPVVGRLMKPAIVVSAQTSEAVAIGTSRFGGRPDLPRGVSWPLAWDVPMEFLAQVRLADFATHDVDGILPKTGCLSFFFYNSQWATSFEQADDGAFDCGRVLYFDDAELVRKSAPQLEIDDEYGRRIVPRTYSAAALSFTPMLSLPNQGAFTRGDDLEELRSVWEEFLEQHGDELPPVSQRAVRSWNQMLGYFAQHDDLQAMSQDDVLLFQIDCDPVPGFDWGKRYFLYFVATKVDVANHDFSRVRVNHGICC